MATYKELVDGNVKCGQFPIVGTRKGCGSSDFTLKQYPMMLNLRDHKEFVVECLVCGAEMSISMETKKGIVTARESMRPS